MSCAKSVRRRKPWSGRCFHRRPHQAVRDQV